ncbi:MAG: PAS domain S-box protein [Spirochaetales bacterium]|nr:PAS domain S-box protein [Spirochaetales bacterium]
MGIFWDISLRKYAEGEVKKARNFIANIIDSMPSVLICVNREGLVTHWNNKAEYQTGLSSEQAENHPLMDVYPHLHFSIEQVLEAIREHEILKAVNIVRQKESEVCYEEITVYPLNSNGVEGAVIRVDDVTEKIRLEEMMIQSEKMLSVGGLAHRGWPMR